MPEIEIDNFTEDFTHNYDDYSVHTLDNDNTSYKLFFENFMLKNMPCIVKNVSLRWDCTEKWIINERINYDYIIKIYGDLEAPVADCNSITFNSQCKSNMKVSDYMSYLKDDKREKLLYLKDWHLRRVKPKDTFYEVPLIFASDWLNEFAIDHNEDDFMFVYIGPKDSWTPLHADVYCSNSWSVNIVGRKKWVLFPPGEEDKLKDPLDNLPLLFDPEKFEDIKYVEIIQEKGDAIFVPSGWHHQVINLIDTISINHNWINGCNIEEVWKALLKSLLSVENEIKEFKDTPEFSSQCQLILKSLFGMDFSAIVGFLNYIGKKRILQLQKEDITSFSNVRLGTNHLLFDLKNVLKIMNLICNHHLFINKLLLQDVEKDFVDTKSEISKILQYKDSSLRC